MPRLTRLAAIAGFLLGAWTLPALAVTPLTPRLADPTHAALLAGLARHGLPEVAGNSVVIALTAALGYEPKTNTFTYEPPAPHLPKVDARARPAAPGCARADAKVVLGATVLRVRGTYCLVGAAHWQSDDQAVTTGR